MSVDLMNHVFRSLEKHFPSAIPPSAATAHKSLSQGQKDDPHAGIGTADAGASPIVRYWTVKFRWSGSAVWNYTSVIACDPFKAALVVTNRDKSIVTAEVVREIDREEFEHLTRSSP
jgi:hypothetical protein